MPPTIEDYQRAVQELVERLGPRPNNDGPAIESAVLVKWAFIADWTTPDGERFLQRTKSEVCSSWDMEGLFRAAVDDGYWGG